MRTERKLIRLNVLKDLHRAYKTDRYKRRIIPINVEFEDPETFFALEYLADKKFVYFKQTNPEYYIAKITPLGKSYLESELDVRVGFQVATAK
jgi:hypothetical protein